MQLLRDPTTLAEKRGGYVHRANTCEDESAFEPAGHTERPLGTLAYIRGQDVFAHLNRRLRSHFFGSQRIKSQGGVAVCRASVGRSHE
jgi:hypothetical protein